MESRGSDSVERVTLGGALARSYVVGVGWIRAVCIPLPRCRLLCSSLLAGAQQIHASEHSDIACLNEFRQAIFHRFIAGTRSMSGLTVHSHRPSGSDTPPYAASASAESVERNVR